LREYRDDFSRGRITLYDTLQNLHKTIDSAGDGFVNIIVSFGMDEPYSEELVFFALLDVVRLGLSVDNW